MATAKTDYDLLNQVKVEPSNNQVQFPEKLDQEYVKEITIINNSDQQMTYKIIYESPRPILAFRPQCGYVKAKDKAIVEVAAGPKDFPKKPNVTFVVRWVIAGANCPEDATDMWIANIVPRKFYQVVKMRVKFGEDKEMSISERSGKDQSSTSEADF